MSHGTLILTFVELEEHPTSGFEHEPSSINFGMAVGNTSWTQHALHEWYIFDPTIFPSVLAFPRANGTIEISNCQDWIRSRQVCGPTARRSLRSGIRGSNSFADLAYCFCIVCPDLLVFAARSETYPQEDID